MSKTSPENICCTLHCTNTVYDESDKCALHCNKHDYSADRRSGLLSDFYSQIYKYISDELFGINYTAIKSFTKNDFEDFCKQGSFDDEAIINTLKHEDIYLNKIVFPARNERDPFDYLKILSLFKSIHFNCSEFFCASLILPEVNVFFQDCQFHNNWSLYDYKQLLNIDKVIYQSCIFYDAVSAYTPDEGRAKLTENQFDFSCVFHKKLLIENVDTDVQLFYSSQIIVSRSLEIKSLEVVNSRFSNKFIINNLKSDSVRFEDVEFNGKFEFKNSQVEQVNISNTNFSKVSDFFKSRFTIFKVYKSIFNQFVGFEKCEFGVKSEPSVKCITQFKFTTFLDFSNFRNAYFYSGLRLDEANFKLPPNFYNAKIDDESTNRETYRIIKNSFDMVGNKLEANKFYSLELTKYKNELYCRKALAKRKLNRSQLCQERVVFQVNSCGSRFGQSFSRPIFIILIVMALFLILSYGKQQNWLYKIMPQYNSEIACVVNFFNSFAETLIPFTPLQKSGMEFLSLVFGLAFSVLIWLTITAIKMHTRR